MRYLVADPYFVMEMLFEVFKEARRLDSNVQQAVGFATTSFGGIILLFLFEIALRSPPLLRVGTIFKKIQFIYFFHIITYIIV